MSTEDDQLRLATVGSEMIVSMPCYVSSDLTSTSSYFIIDKGRGEIETTVIHNLPGQALSRLRIEGNQFRQIVIGADSGEVVLKRVVFNGTEYHLTATS